MKKIVLTFGLIAGVVLSAMMLITMPLKEQIGFDRMEIIGYTSMILAFLLIFFGIRSYRDNVAGGSVRFVRAFTVGMLIAVVAAICYSATWMIISDRYAPDLMQQWSAHVIEKARADGETEAQLAERKAEMDKWGEMYKNPVIKAAFTFVEPMPVALIVSLVSAGLLSRRRRNMGEPGATLVGIGG